MQVPYGNISKKAFTGSEATISAAVIEKQQVSSFTRALEGTAPGVSVTNGNGPGSSASIRIRGFGSVNASSSPLYVLDGVPFNGSLNSLSTDEIESITVLKDASAAALYGSRAANGVIMIATKRGSKNRTKISASVRNGFMNRSIPEYDRVNQKEYYELMWEATRNAYVAAGQKPDVAGANASKNLTGPNALVYNAYNVPGDQLVDPVTGKLNPSATLLWDDDWQKELIRSNAPRLDVNFNVSGGGDKNDYFFSMGYVNEDGIAKHSGFNRYNLRAKVNSQMTKWLNGGVNIYGATGETKQLMAEGSYTSNPFYYTRVMGPIYPIWQRDAKGAFITNPETGERVLDWGVPEQMGTRPYASNANLVGTLALDDRSFKSTNATANTFLEAKFLKDFSFKSTLGVDFYNSNGTTFQNSLFGDAANVKGRSTKTNTRNMSYTFNQILSWSKKFNEHSITALAGHENYQFKSNYLSAKRSFFPFPGNSELANAANPESSTSYENLHRIESYFSSANYSYMERYLLSASFRRDASSRFAKDNRWGNFWSVGGGWRISEEDFLKNSTWLNELKYKFSYGEQGNEDLLNTDGSSNYYVWQGLYELGMNNAMFPGAVISTLQNPDITWESNKSLNTGFDFVLFNRLQGSIEYFDRRSVNLLFNVPLPLSTGIGSIASNAGTLKNYGVELQLGYNAVKNDDFDWRIDLNLTRFRNKITALPQSEIISGSKKLMVGKSIYDFWIKDYAGVDPQTGDALFYYDVLDADKKPTGEIKTTPSFAKGSYYYKGSAIPDFNGGLTNSFRYKNFDLSALLTFQVGGKFYNSNYATLMHAGTYGNHWSKDILKRWQKPGDITNVPRLQNKVADQTGVSTRWLFDASYLNIKNISLGYNFSKTLLAPIGVTGLRVYTTVDNAALFTKQKGMDPQRAFSGTSDFNYIPYRTYTFGLNVNL